MLEPVQVVSGHPLFQDAVLGHGSQDRAVLYVGQHVVIAVHRHALNLASRACFLQGAGRGCTSGGIDADDHVQVGMRLDQLCGNGQAVSRVGFLVHFGHYLDVWIVREDRLVAFHPELVGRVGGGHEGDLTLALHVFHGVPAADHANPEVIGADETVAGAWIVDVVVDHDDRDARCHGALEGLIQGLVVCREDHDAGGFPGDQLFQYL